MLEEFEREFEALVGQYAELLVGASDAETLELVRKWAIYSQIHKTMPALAAHWNRAHPEAKVQVRAIFEQVKARNEALKAKAAGEPAAPDEQAASSEGSASS